MGKAQSKRSVDITTETKKGSEDEVTEKMEKIEDLDKKEVVNGDAIIPQKNDLEKKGTEEEENDKDMTTEKDVEAQVGEDAKDTQNNTAEASKDDVGSATAEEISPLADDNIKKSKKEKVKKKWSFRSISFGKKDKLKPAKNEDAAEDGSAATNGADTEEKTITEPGDTQRDKCANEKEEKTTENHENGEATPQELNGDELNEEKISDEKSNDITANTINNTITTETCVSVQKETAAVSSELSEKTENTAVTIETKISENATAEDPSKYGNGKDEKMTATQGEPLKADITNASVEAPSEKKSTLDSVATNMSSASTNGEVVDKIHQNGDHGESEQEVVEKSKAQIEVNSNTDNKVSAATLDYNSTTYINPSTVQIHVQDLNASGETHDEIVQINTDDSLIQKSTDIDINNHVVQSPISEIVSVVDFENKVKPEPTVSYSISETVDNEKSFDLSPPPLPISPPPSQVSVFAFTNNGRIVEDAVETKSFEQVIVDNINMEESEKTILPLSSIQENFNAEPQIQDVNVNTSNEFQCPPDIVVEEEEASFSKDRGNEVNSSVIFEESLVEEEKEEDEEEEPSVHIAAEVINEITTTAAEIVHQQIFNEKPITDLYSLQDNEERKDEDISENIISECVGGIEQNTDKDKESVVDCQELQFERAYTPLASEQTNNVTSDLLQDQDQHEMISLKKIKILEEEHLDPIKEFANANDLKDKAIVAEITQDLSVTCE